MSDRKNVIDIKQLMVHCAQCQVRELCLPVGLSQTEVGKLERLIDRRQVLKPGRQLFYQGQNFRHLYVVRSGSLKTLVVDSDGNERITGFHLPGELLGLDAIANEHHTCIAQALETSNICAVPFADLEALTQTLPSLQHHLLFLMSRELQRDQQVMTLLSSATAEQRLAALILNLACRFRQQGLSSYRFRLSMPRGDIANYLGLALETVSRTIKRFQRNNTITLVGREVTINDTDALKSLAFPSNTLPTHAASKGQGE